jgi:hypothetical protein
VTRTLLAVCLTGAAVFALAVTTPVRAEDEEYESIIRSALAEYQAGRYEEATALFARAHAMQPSARTHRGLGLAYFEARRYSLAVVHLKASLADQRRPLTPDQRANAQQVLHDASQFVARVRVQLEPGAAVLEVDGHAPDRDGALVLLDAGRHELTASAEGYTTVHRDVDARAAESMTLRIALEPLAAGAPSPARPELTASPTPAAEPRPAVAPDSGRSWLRPGPLIVLGAGALLLGGAGVTWLLANDAHDDLERACPARACETQRYEDDVTRGKTMVTLTNVFLITGAVALVAGGSYWLLDSDDRSTAKLNGACTVKGCAATLHAAF